ncbi:uncharacterized protein LOC132296500 [Cornus florida]|uniref:uncharacterized protein LOC132296500 n=1 Tax=Cornus florida TaxID=4283 RepID=UPI002897403B|nr:uncharacterized protein LOC132296500 [Cornus florida]
MANLNGHLHQECQSNTSPPWFDGTNCGYLKNTMIDFLQSVDYQIWLIIVNGPFVPMKIVDTRRIPKTEAEWDTEDYKLISLNAKAKVNLNCAISPSEYNRVSTCTTAKEIWDKLQVTYEGTSQVKESKIDILMHQYELFRMNENESISAMFVRFTDIINGLKHLGRTMTNSDLARKILGSLPEKWDAKATTIKEAHNLNTLELDELLGSLLSWEITLKDREGDHHRKKEITLKVSQIKKEVAGNKSEDDDSALITQSFKRFLHRKKFNKGRFKKGESSNEQSKRDTSACFRCGKSGHFKADCHVYKEEKKKRRAMQANWEDGDSNGSESDIKKAILFLMANRDEVNSNYNSSSKCEMSYDDLVDAFNGLLDDFKELHDELGKMVKKCASQRREKLIIESKFQTLLNENKCLKKECTLLKETGSPELISENASLKLIIEDQIDGLAKFTQGTKNLKLMLGAQRSVFYKNGLGYDPFDKKACLLKKRKPLANYFVKSKNKNSRYNYCKRMGHLIQECSKRKPKYIKKWVLKGTYVLLANSHGPNKIWVPSENT